MTSKCEACTRSYTYLLILHISLVFTFLVGHPSTCFSKSCPYRNAVFTSVELSGHFYAIRHFHASYLTPRTSGAVCYKILFFKAFDNKQAFIPGLFYYLSIFSTSKGYSLDICHLFHVFWLIRISSSHLFLMCVWGFLSKN